MKKGKKISVSSFSKNRVKTEGKVKEREIYRKKDEKKREKVISY